MSTARPWTTPADVEAQVERLWDRGHLLGAELAFPLPLRLVRPDARDVAERWGDVRKWIVALEAGSKAARGVGYEIAWEEVNHRQTGRNRLPVALTLPTVEDALALIGKRRQADRFARLAEATRASFPELSPWLARRPFAALERADDWDRVLAVLTWFRSHPRPGVYLRQVDVPSVDTKFIEERRGLFTELLDLVLPEEAVDRNAVGARQFEARFGLRSKPALVRFRFLDPAQGLSGLSDVATPAAEFARLAPPVTRVFITENDVNGLAFPPVANAIVIFGLGYGLDRLSETPWLRDRTVFYWGDIDTHGFAMLDRLRAALPEARSFLMDRETMLAHRSLWAREPVRHEGPFTRLSNEEQTLVAELLDDRHGTSVRLEQERIGFGWLERALATNAALAVTAACPQKPT